MINKGKSTVDKPLRVHFYIGLSVSILVALILPIGYIALSYSYVRGALESEADINATTISTVINLNPELWRYEQMRLQELLSRRPRFGHAETRRILDRNNVPVAESVNKLRPPVVTRSCDLLDAKVPIGRVEISRSLFPTLLVTGIVALCGLFLGVAIFYLLWELAFRRMLLAEKRRREFIDKVMENGPHAVMVLDPEGAIAVGNAQSSLTCGVAAQQLVGRPFAALFEAADAPAVENRLVAVASSKVAMANFDAKLRHQSGRSLHVTCAISPLVLEGKVINLLVSVQDISDQIEAHEELRLYAEDLGNQVMERRKVEEALRQSEARFRNLLQEVGSVAVRGYAPDGTTQYWNRACERLYGYSAQEAIGKNLSQLIIPVEVHDVDSALRQEARSGQPTELTLKRKDGSQVSVYSSQVTVRIPGRMEEVFFIEIDLSERNKNQEEKAKLEGKLQQAQKMELIGRLAGGVAHDFNNMLTVIIGYANIALLDLTPDEPLHANFTEIYKAAERFADLTRQLLAFARRQAIEPKVLDLNQMVTGMINMIQRLIGEAIQLDWRPGEELWPVKVDPSQVDQILANLCVNARDAIAGIGTITVEAGNRTVGTDYCTHLSWFAPGEYVRLAVSDNGPGIDQEVLPHIFEPFYTTKGVGKGTGLGLATVYGIVKQNNGFINVQSEPGQGTTFEIFLPRHSGEDELAQAEGAAKPPLCGKETILLVEDEPSILKLIKKMLASLDYRVLTAGNPIEALDLARQCNGEIHLVLTDLIMPEMNGNDLAMNLLELYPHLKHLLMSGYSANAMESQGILKANFQFLPKPFSLQEMAAKVREVLDGP